MLILIITATLDSDTTIENTISSIRCQTIDNVEHIFCDGGSKN